jgi:predicted delta-1-pyrroline-5-carboxylate dehydrogenase group 2
MISSMKPAPTPFKNEPPADFGRSENRGRFEKAIATAEKELAGIPKTTVTDAERAVRRALGAFSEWNRRPPGDRAEILFKAASLLRSRKMELAAMILLEVHKNRQEADADVCEAIDFLEYYGREMIRIAEEEPKARPIGVVAVIAPWNFPLAILTGMTAGALVAGNTVVMKPAEQSPRIAFKLFEIYKEAGVPEGVLQYLPGIGEVVGDFLVRSPDVAMVAFTGSKEVGTRIASLKSKVISEVGGKNAIIVDESADVEAAVEGTLLSAFGYQGQKCSACSRVILLPEVYERFKKRFLEKAAEIRIGDPKNPENFMGPVIDEEALQKIARYIEIGKKEAKLLYEGKAPEGRYVAPTIFGDVSPKARIAQEEIFGPVVCLIKAKNLDEAVGIANHVPYDLTGGLFSKDPKAIERVKKEFEVGNLYINRKITGALVACQPFGGYRLSSLGFKAGGPEYLHQFLDLKKKLSPPAERKLPSADFQPSDRNTLLYIKEKERLLSKTICERG